jgi:hypothetical protein
MTRRLPGFLTTVRVLIIMTLALAPARAADAQAVGAGPLTESLAVTEPTSGVFSWGPVKLAPGMVVDEAGYDSNIFDERDNPREDWLFRGTPDLSLFSAVRFAKVSLYAGSQLAYFKTYTDENSVGYEYRGRLDLLISRIRPYIGGGETRTRERPNGEIDTRADQRQQELSGGLAFGLGPHSQVYAGVVRSRQEFFNSVEEGVPLSEALNHDSYNYTAGVQTDITPLATLTLSGSYQEDRFESSPLRDGNGSSVTAGMLIGAEAVVSGTIEVSYLSFKPVDPAIVPFDGMTVTAGIAYPFLEIGRLNFSIIRGIEYSFDEGEGYYKETSIILAYTHRLFGEIDFQARGSKSWFDYGFRDTTAARTDTLAAAAASVGYNLRNRTRISLNYEVAQRRSPAYLERNYDRTRVYLSWAYAF